MTLPLKSDNVISSPDNEVCVKSGAAVFGVEPVVSDDVVEHPHNTIK